MCTTHHQEYEGNDGARSAQNGHRVYRMISETRPLDDREADSAFDHDHRHDQLYDRLVATLQLYTMFL